MRGAPAPLTVRAVSDVRYGRGMMVYLSQAKIFPDCGQDPTDPKWWECHIFVLQKCVCVFFLIL